MTLQLSILLLCDGICLLLGILSYMNGDRDKGNRYFAFMTLSIAIWTAVTFFEEENIPFNLKPLLIKIDYASGFLITYFYLIFTSLFSGNYKTISRNWWAVIHAFAILIVTACFTNLFVAGLKQVNELTFRTEDGKLYIVYGIALALNLLFGTYFLIKNFKLATIELKTQIKYIVTGLAVSASIAIITNLIIPQFFEVSSIIPRIGVYAIILFLVTTTVIVTKHGLFNVKVFTTEIFISILLALLLLRAMTSNNIQDIIFNSLLIAAAGVFSYLLVKSVQGEIGKREMIEKLATEKTKILEEVEDRNKNLAGLQKIADIVLNELEMKPMTQSILNQIPQQIEGCIGAILSMKEGNNLVGYGMSDFPFSKEVYHLIGGGLDRFSMPIDMNSGLINAAFNSKKPTESDSLADFVSPPLPKSVAFTIQKLIRAQYIYAMPLHSEAEDVGVLVFVFSDPKEKVEAREIDMLEAISNEMNLAIQRVLAYKKLKEANEYLVQVDKMKDEFLSMASHELNTPLAAIEGYLSMILDENIGKIDEKSRTFLDRAYASSKRLAGLILDLLNVSRIEQGRLQMKFEQVNMADLAQDVIHELQVRADGKKVYLKLEADASKIPPTFCDQQRIREVITNLAGNAIKFTEQGGVTICVTATNQTITVQVKDTGRGISREDQAKLFKKFSQVNREKDQQQGTGLGLYISKNYVELHKGKIWIESEVGKGTVFTFELPIMTEVPKEIEGAKIVNNEDNTATFSGQTMPQAQAGTTTEQLKSSTETSTSVTTAIPASVSTQTQAPATVAPQPPSEPQVFVPTPSIPTPQVPIQPTPVPQVTQTTPLPPTPFVSAQPIVPNPEVPFPTTLSTTPPPVAPVEPVPTQPQPPPVAQPQVASVTKNPE